MIYVSSWVGRQVGILTRQPKSISRLISSREPKVLATGRALAFTPKRRTSGGGGGGRLDARGGMIRKPCTIPVNTPVRS